MKRVQWIVLLVTIYALFYQFTPYIDDSGKLTAFMFVLAPFLVIWMGYSILKHGSSSGKSFDRYFYDDWDYERNGKEELN